MSSLCFSLLVIVYLPVRMNTKMKVRKPWATKKMMYFQMTDVLVSRTKIITDFFVSI